MLLRETWWLLRNASVLKGWLDPNSGPQSFMPLPWRGHVVASVPLGALGPPLHLLLLIMDKRGSERVISKVK